MKTINIKTIIMLIAMSALFFFTACEDVLDRPPLSEENDDSFWTSESKLRLYANGFYPRYFVGYNSGWGTEYAPLNGYEFSDDMVANGAQTGFELSVPNDRGNNTSTLTTIPWLANYSGPNWNFAWPRRANIMIDRINNRMGGVLNEEQKNHWLGIGRFFRAMDYAGLVQVFGDVPYYDHEVNNVDPADIYKPRTPRDEVMDAVYDDFVFAMQNVRSDDGAMNVNKYVVAGFISRLALFEGTWQKYHKNNNERAKKFLNLAVEAANLIKGNGKYDVVTEFRNLFNSEDLAGNKDVIFYRHYDPNYGITHCVSSYCNLSENRYTNPSLSLVKAFICNDGSDWQTSATAANKNFDMSNLIATRDPRFEATFFPRATTRSLSSCIYTVKFISRIGVSYEGSGLPAEFTSTNNKNDYPVIRYAEVLLNWIEAKAELATLGGDAVTQGDIDISINKIRNRPIASEAVALGVKKTAALSLAGLPSSPDKGDVPQLIWEIRRERRMEMAFEYSRLLDLKRWKKLEYMDPTLNPDIIRGTWINANSTALNSLLKPDILAVTDMNGTVIVYNGSNAAQMIGFYSPTNITGRQAFLGVLNVNPYLAPVGRNQRIEYQKKGYELAQTEGWPSDL
ncbi:RagB/SusD family nutrient uptake outer membrane protein [Dysgonomonas reticulitermitis]